MRTSDYYNFTRTSKLASSRQTLQMENFQGAMITHSGPGATAVVNIGSHSQDITGTANSSTTLEQIYRKVQRNSLTLIIKLLPVEILTKIFCCLQTPWEEVEKYQNYVYLAMVHNLKVSETRKVWDWTVVTHVCHYWRIAALEYPSLWALIRSDSHKTIEQTRTYLERSKSAPLTVRHRQKSIQFYRRHVDTESFLLEVLKELYRIRDLRIILEVSTPLKIKELLAQPAPLLQRLELDWPEPQAGIRAYVDTLGTLFQGETPQMRSLSIRNTRFSLQSPLLKNLRSLVLQNIGMQLIMSTLFKVLASCPEMEEMRIWTSGVQRGDNPVEDSENAVPEDYLVTLPSLRVLELSTISSATYEVFYNHVKIPITASWCFNLSDHRIDHTKPLGPSILHREGITDHLRVTLGQFGLAFESIAPDYGDNDNFTVLRLNWGTPTLPTRVFELASQCLAKRQYWCNATTLQICLADDMMGIYPPQEGFNEGDSCWTSVLGLFPNLQKLEVVFSMEFNANSDNFTAADQIYLMRTLRNHCRQNESLLCPKLATLILECAVFKPLVLGDFFVELQSCLQVRHERGHAISQLGIFDGCAVNRNMIDILKSEGYVERVNWDEISADFSSRIYGIGSEDEDFAAFGLDYEDWEL